MVTGYCQARDTLHGCLTQVHLLIVVSLKKRAKVAYRIVSSTLDLTLHGVARTKWITAQRGPLWSEQRLRLAIDAVKEWASSVLLL
jgi:hypothetical protein